jgi:enoyl-CoA hydratase
VDDTDLQAVVLTGTPKIFSAGMDLADPFFARLPDVPLDEMRHYSERGPRLARAWASIEAPVICAVEGACMAGGLALGCQCRLPGRCAQRKVFGTGSAGGAQHGLALGATADCAGRCAGNAPGAAGWDEWTGEEAHRLGFVDYLAEPGQAFDEALALAQRLASFPGLAMRMVKRQIDAAAHANDYALSAYDKDQQLVVWMSEDFAEARRKFAK